MGTVKYTGPVASFHCPTNAEIRSLKVHFSPKQEGAGDPSPSNVRPIVGWDGVVVHNDDGNVVPEEYQKVEYIQTSSGGTYIDSGIVMSWDLVFEINFQLTETTKARYFMGEYAGGSFYLYTGLGTGTDVFFQTAFGASWQNTTLLADTTRHRFTYSFSNGRTILKDGNNVIWDRAAASLSDRNILVAGTPSSGIPVKTFSSKMFKNGVAIQNLIPCRRKSDDKPGMYDTVSQTFFTNQGTGEFICGPDVGETTDYEFGVLGKNKFDKNTVTDYHRINGSGEIVAQSGMSISDYIRVAPTQVYSLTTTGDISGNKRHAYYNANKEYLDVFPGGSTTLTIPSDAQYIRLTLYNDALDTTQLELGSTATTYEPYDPKHTVYGGWVDLISGEVCETNIVYTGGWVQYAESNGYKRYELTNILLGDQNNLQNISNITKLFSNISSSTKDNRIQPVSQGSVSIRAYLSLDENINVDNIQYGYKLATPITYQLAPSSMQTFLGHNNVWSNADYVEVEYDLHETQTLLQRKAFIMANQPHIVKPAAASLQNFKTDVIAPLKECKVHFSPVQEGTGDPSPDNVRAISGWTGITVSLNRAPLPAEYQEVEYIQSNSIYSYFITDYYPSDKTDYYIKIHDGNSVTGDYKPIAFSAGTSFELYKTGYYAWKQSKGNIVNSTAGYGVNRGLIEMISEKTSWKIMSSGDPSLQTPGITTTPPVFQSENPLIILAGEQNGEIRSNKINDPYAKLYRLTFSENSVKVRDYIPCYRKSDNEVGLYDVITNQFLTHSGEGTFVAGPNIVTGSLYHVNFPSEAGTVYGGYVDLVKGEVVQEWVKLTYTGQFDMNQLSSHIMATCTRSYFPPNRAELPNIADIQSGYCNMGKRKSSGYDVSEIGFYFGNATEINIYTGNNLTGIVQGTDDVDSARQKIKAYYAEHPIEICWKISPITYQISPLTLKTLRGTNNVWSTANGNLEISYWGY